MNTKNDNAIDNKLNAQTPSYITSDGLTTPLPEKQLKEIEVIKVSVKPKEDNNKEDTSYSKTHKSNKTKNSKGFDNNNTKTVNLTSLNTTSNTKNSAFFQYTKLQPFNLKPKGIYNPSVYCFMNTCLQCLITIPEINYFFYNREFSSISRNTGLQACEALYRFIDYYKDSKGSFQPPSVIYDVCHSFLSPNRQHDSQEFMRHFLGKIQDEINGKPKYFLEKCKSLTEAWTIYIEKNHSIIDQTFAGMFKSSVICKKCKHTSGKIVYIYISYILLYYY